MTVSYHALLMHKMIRHIAMASDALTGLVNDIMIMARLEAGHEQVQPVMIDNLQAELKEVVTTFEMEAATKEISITITTAEPTPVVYWDIVRLRYHALNNLVSNAIRFSPHGGTIDISVHATEEGVMLGVSDEGPGIPPDEREYIFGRLNQGSSPRVYNGAGLGLYNTRLFVERHGGSVTAKENPAGGTLFAISLPYDARPFIDGGGE